MANLRPEPSPFGPPGCNNTGSSVRSSISNDSGYLSEASKRNADTESRFEEQDYMRRLKKTKDTMPPDPKFWSPSPWDQELLGRVDSTSDEPGSWEIAPVTVRQLLLRICDPTASIYDIELTVPGFDCGTILLTDPSLQQLCALGHRLKSKVAGFDLKPEFLMEHLTTRRKPTFSPDPRFMCSVDAWAVEQLNIPGSLEFVLEQPEGREEAVLAEALIRVTCYSVQESLFLVLVRVPQQPLPQRPQDRTAAIPVSGWDTFHKTPERPKGGLEIHLARCIGDFFSEEWSCRRVHDLWTTTPRIYKDSRTDEMRSHAFLWVLSLQGFGRKVDRLNSQVQKFEYEQFQLTSSEALSKNKEYRSEVAKVRRDIACYRDFVRINSLVECYQICHEKESRVRWFLRDDPEYQAKKLNTARQKASVSFDEEYDWLDGKARETMPLLNQNLQLIVASMTIEDAAVSKKNGERSTVFAGLAAVYLPLSLATGIFGMNLRETDTASLRDLWSFVKVAAVLVSVTVIAVVLSFKRHAVKEAIPKLKGCVKRQVACFGGKAAKTQHDTDGIELTTRTPFEEQSAGLLRA